MPYYLVTQTQLVEADNPEAAAGKALDKITRANRLSFSVKLDETTTKVVVVTPPAHNLPSSPGSVQVCANEPVVQGPLETSAGADAFEVSHQTVIMSPKRPLVCGVALLSVCAVCAAFWYGF